MTRRETMIDSIIACLPENYGRVTTNFQEMPAVTNIGIVLPTFSRQDYLLKTLESLRSSALPKNCMLVIVDETMASKMPTIDQYEYFENIDFEGGDIKQINRELDEVRKEAELIESCVAFNEAGWLKHSLVNPRPVQNSRFGTYIKRTFLQKNPTVHRQVAQYSQTCKSTIDTGTVAAIEAFDMDIPIIKLYKTEHKNMFDSLRTAFDLLIGLYNVRYLVTIDSDTIHTGNWLTELLKAYEDLHCKLSDGPLVLSGFNADNKKNLLVKNKYVVKDNLGGINLFFDTQTYKNYVRDTLVHVGWDIHLSKIIRSRNGSLVALYNSVVQHIGIEGMWSSHANHDHSSTFQPLGSATECGSKKNPTILKKILRLKFLFGRNE